MRCLLISSVILCAAPAMAAEFRADMVQIDDRKAVIGTVEPVHQLVARAQLGGTLTRLNVREGDLVKAGDVLGIVADAKLALQALALDQRIHSQQATRDQAQVDFDRVQELQRRGVSTQAQLDLAHTALDVAQRTLAAMEADRNVLNQQMNEGRVLAPGAGRVLSVPVSEGRVIMAGEAIATMAEERYILRLALPERHAHIMQAGDKVEIARRGTNEDMPEQRREGRVRLVYPEITGGRVIADVEVDGLGDYFVGERTRVFISTGKRSAITVPQTAVYRCASTSFVRLKSGVEILVQTGEPIGEQIEILTGLKAGDIVLTP